MKAIWNNTIIAESSNTKIVENNHYFPMDDVKNEYFKPSDSHTRCPWKGKASYFHIEIDGEINEDAAWYYPNPKEAAQHIEGRVAFYPSVDIIDT